MIAPWIIREIERRRREREQREERPLLEIHPPQPEPVRRRPEPDRPRGPVVIQL